MPLSDYGPTRQPSPAVDNAQLGADAVADPAALTSATLTDSSGGTPGTTIAAIGASYTQSEVRNAVASLAAQVNALRVDLAAVRTKLIALLTSLETATPNPLLPT